MTEQHSESGFGNHRAALESFYAEEVKYVAAGGARAGADFAGMAAHLHPDVVVHQGPSVPYPGDWQGIAGLERFFAVFSDTWLSLDLSETKYFEGETGVAISLRMRATARRTGKTVDTRIGQFLTFDHGLIRDFTVFYLDPVQVGEATLP
ncbi:nuclear transport factor 2 family protein [Amycolatopsis pithecellobii]|uniref:Nuclear transport factor 2 family protein n=1 Tax=Amycolatopsis pithecellobii TaxID=664692 RepID=A0A6N7YPK6_9PSEU|nr:nuclear transport factor 2 family protein [Amycolatopsis pithecellobii]MTD54935.1 nuclear transport factor 2 family protein [Amycolatopsis pithecellobii]